MRIFVTGATGFIGNAFCHLARQCGHEVAVLVNPERSVPPRGVAESEITCIPGRLASLPWQEIARFQPEVCVHGAWITTPGEYLESPLNEQFLNWSVALLERLPELGIRQFVGLGTCFEYQPGQTLLREDGSPLSYATRYARCKNLLHEAALRQSQAHGWTCCWGRVFYPYGVGEHPARLCTAVIRKLRAGESLELKTPHSRKDYIYVDDLAAAILLSIERRFQGTINWGSGEGHPVREIADTAAKLLGRPELVVNAANPAHDPVGD